MAIRLPSYPNTKNAPQQSWSALFSFSLCRDTQKIIRRHLKEITERNNIPYAGFKLAALDVGYFALRHIYSLRKLGLVQVTVFP